MQHSSGGQRPVSRPADRPDGPVPDGAAQGTPPLLRVHLLGGFRVIRDGGAPPAERWTRPSAQALVKLLAVTPGHSIHREQAMAVCWPNADPHSALGSLRVALHAARRAIQPDLAPRTASAYLTGEGMMLRLDPHTVWIDADHAEELAEAALADGGAAELARALEAFTGELLPEDLYAEWSGPRRERLNTLHERVQLALAEAYLAEGSLVEAIAVAERALAAGPAEERAHRVLIAAHLRDGRRRLALRQYHLCRQALDEELGVRPGAETEWLHRMALDDTEAKPTGRTADPSLPAALRTPPVAPLRGRRRTMELVLSGGSPVVLVGGEAGVGKTRLVSEAARRAAADGAVVLWGAGHEAEGHTPYGAFAEALDGWLAEQPPGGRARAGAEYPELAALLPSLGRIGDQGTDRTPEEERDRLFRAAAGLLDDLTASGPVLVVLDDLHAADTGTFQLLSHLARRAGAGRYRWRFAVTYREEELGLGDPRRTGLDALVRQGLAQRVELMRLGRDECLALAADALDTPSPDGVTLTALDRVWELSLGNPLFTLELARTVRDGTAAEELSAPEGVRQLVAERLGRLGTTARRLVEVLAVGGGDAALAEVLDVAANGLHPPVTGAEAADALDSALAAALIAERSVVTAGRPAPGLAFRHPLVRLTCYDQLTAVRRRHLHAAFADAVLRHRPDAVDALASHLVRAHDPRAVDYLGPAARRAAALCANDSADRYYRELVARLDTTGDPDTPLIRLEWAAVLRRMARYPQAAEVLRAALRDFGATGEHDAEVLAAARLSEVLVRSGTPEAGLRVLLAYPPGADCAPEAAAGHHIARSVVCFVMGRYEDGVTAAAASEAAALRIPGAAGQVALARALAQQATSLSLSGRFDQAQPLTERALAVAEAAKDPAVLGTVLSVTRENARRAGRLREACATGQRALELVEHAGDPTAMAFERTNLAELHLLLDESEEAERLALSAVSLAEPFGEWCLAFALVALARVRLPHDLPGAARLLARAEVAAVDSGDRQALDEVRTAQAELAVRADRPDDALKLLGTPASAAAATLTAWAHLVAGRAGQAAALAEAEAARAAHSGERLAEVDARTVHAAALTRLNDTAAADAAFAQAETLAASLQYPMGTSRLAKPRSTE
ncbi:AAA family ATPase [Streptomyces sp. NPDC056159]|uniref:ATP-binding protein n=1 Tax=unclassified Streptomyces TaxID=2593676 RepID=UPI003415C0AA